MGRRRDVVDAYMDEHFISFDGERGVKNLEQLCEVLGYGSGFMRGRAIEEMLGDNPGAVEAVVGFLMEWAERNTEWNAALAEAVEEEEDCGV